MKNHPIKTQNPLSKVQIVKHAFIFALSFLLLPSVHAQYKQETATATAFATATVVTEMIGATQFESMNFAKGNNEGKTDINAASVATGKASFKIIGNYAYDVTFPTKNILLTTKANSNTMTVGSFCVTSAKDSPNTDEVTLIIGSVLNLNSGQSEGNYSAETPFTVTVNYN